MERKEEGGKDVVPTPPSALPGAVNRRLVVWGPDGLPVPASVPLLSKPQIDNLAAAALSLPYQPTPPSNSLPKEKFEEEQQRYLAECAEFEGMSNAEVMMVRLARAAANGDKDTANMLLDRVLGKPKQSVESKTMKLTYEDYLQELARSASGAPTPPAPASAADGRVVDISPCPPDSSPPSDEMTGLI